MTDTATQELLAKIEGIVRERDEAREAYAEERDWTRYLIERNDGLRETIGELRTLYREALRYIMEHA